MKNSLILDPVSLYLLQAEIEKIFDVYSQLINCDGIKCNHIKLLCNQSGIFSLNCSSLNILKASSELQTICSPIENSDEAK